MDPLVFHSLYSLVMLALGAWSVSEGADILSSHFDASVVGGLIIAWLNTAPETIFFLVALNSGNPKFALGALSGSVMVVCTVALGLGVFLAATQSRNKTITLDKTVRDQARILAMTVPLVIFIYIDGFCISFALLGVLEYSVFVWMSLQGGSSVVKPKTDVEQGGGHGVDAEPVMKGYTFLFIGGLIIWLFSDDFIESVVDLGTKRRIDPILLSFFFAPIASEAPEILESVSLSLKGSRDSINVAVSNLIGGTISKTTLLASILCLFGYSKGFVWKPGYTMCVSIIVVSATCAALLVWLPSRLGRGHGVALLSLFLLCSFMQYANVHHYDFPDMMATELASNALGSLGSGEVSSGTGVRPVRDIISEINLDPFA